MLSEIKRTKRTSARSPNINFKGVENNEKKEEMTWKELNQEFRKAEEKGKSILGYVVFTKDSFTKEYTEKERTYEISSHNKAFIKGMGGYSIYANCLDGKDLNVRIEQYMTDIYGGKDGWKIEKCYILKE